MSGHVIIHRSLRPFTVSDCCMYLLVLVRYPYAEWGAEEDDDVE